MLMDLQQDRFKYGLIPLVPFLGAGRYGELPEVAGGIVAAEAAGAIGKPSFWRQVGVGVATGLLIYAGHKLLDRVLVE